MTIIPEDDDETRQSESTANRQSRKIPVEAPKIAPPLQSAHTMAPKPKPVVS